MSADPTGIRDARDIAGRWRRMVLVAGAVGTLLVALAAPAVPATTAAWVDPESTKTRLAAANVPEPAAGACTTRTGALGVNQVTLTWSVPAAAAGHSSATVEFGQRTNSGTTSVIPTSTLTTITTTGTAAAYTTQISGVPLGGTLGDKKTFALRFTGPGGWSSDWVDACTFDVVRSRILASQMSVTASSRNRDSPESQLIDDTAATIWQSQFSQFPVAVYPHTITVDLGHAQTIDGMSYLTRNRSNGAIKKYTIQVSVDGVSYTDVASGEWAWSATWQDVNFTRRSARYLRIVALSSVTGTGSAAGREVVVFGTPTP